MSSAPESPVDFPLAEWIEDVTLLHAEGAADSQVKTYVRLRYGEETEARVKRERLMAAMSALQRMMPHLISAGVIARGPVSLPRAVAVALHRFFGRIAEPLPGEFDPSLLLRSLAGEPSARRSGD